MTAAATDSVNILNRCPLTIRSQSNTLTKGGRTFFGISWYSKPMSKITAIAVAICCLLIIEIGSVRADELDAQRKALNLISEFADKICGDIPLQGSSSKIEASGKAKAELPGVIKKLADLGLEGAAKYQDSKYQGG